MNPGPSRALGTCRTVALREGGFTLIELLVVMGIIAILLVLMAPAFTTLKSGADVTSAAYTIKGVLDQARTYAKANNAYTWVGFFEENVSVPSPAPAGIGRVVMSIVASKDGTNVISSGATNDPTKLSQVGKLTKIDDLHLATFTDGSGTGSTFATRPPVTFSGTQYSFAGMANSATTLFPYPLAGTLQYAFVKAVQFSSDGEAQIISNSANAVQTAAEIGLEPTHGNVVPNPAPANLVAIQFGGVGADVVIYRK